jgi:hypothetical protein
VRGLSRRLVKLLDGPEISQLDETRRERRPQGKLSYSGASGSTRRDNSVSNVG